MKFPKIVAILFTIAVIVASCSKEESFSANGSGGSGSGSGSGSGAGSIQGNWKLISSSGSTTASTSLNLFGTDTKIETELRFSSSNPVGMYTISSTNFTGKGIGYDYTGKLIIRTFENNVLQTEDSSDITTTIPPSNPDSKYKLVGADSIYFEGTPGTPSAPGTSGAVQPGGCKYKLEGKRLTMYMKTFSSQVNNSGGTVSKDTQRVNATIVLEKI